MKYCCKPFEERAEIFHSFYKVEINGRKHWIMDFNKEDKLEGVKIIIGYCQFCGSKLII